MVPCETETDNRTGLLAVLDALANLSPEERAQFADMLGGGMAKPAG